MVRTLHEKACEDFEVGDTVKVCFKVPSHFGGWRNSWTEEMDQAVGQSFTIAVIDEEMGVDFDEEDIGCSFPAFCLQKAPKPVQYSVKSTGSTGEKSVALYQDRAVITLYPHQPYLENITLTKSDLKQMLSYME